MTLAPVTLEEINNAGSIDELVRLYGSRGHSFSNEEEFLIKLRQDWEGFREDVLTNRKKPIAEEILPLEVAADGQEFRIYGVAHFTGPSSNFDEEYYNVLKRSIYPLENALTEQYLDDYLQLGRAIHFCDIKGMELVPMLERRLSPFQDHLESFGVGLFGTVSMLFSPLLIPLILREKYVESVRIRKEASIKRKVDEVIQMILDPGTMRLTHNLPPEVEMELAARKKRYSGDQKRSAYMAEFAKRCSTVKGTKNIITGARHAWEIKYFLQNEIRDDKVIEAVNSDLAVLETGTERYEIHRNVAYSRENRIARTFFRSGVLTGLATDAAALYALYQLLS